MVMPAFPTTSDALDLSRPVTMRGMAGRRSKPLDHAPNRILEHRLRKGMTQERLGELCGVSDEAIRKYETGKSNVTVYMLGRLARALAIKTYELLSDYDGPRDAQELELLAGFRRLTDAGKDAALNIVDGMERPRRRA